MILSYIVGIGCSAILAGVAAFMFINDNSNNTAENKSDSVGLWHDDTDCHYEGDF